MSEKWALCPHCGYERVRESGERSNPHSSPFECVDYLKERIDTLHEQLWDYLEAHPL